MASKLLILSKTITCYFAQFNGQHVHLLQVGIVRSRTKAMELLLLQIYCYKSCHMTDIAKQTVQIISEQFKILHKRVIPKQLKKFN
jgi:hypothetical protein